MTKDEILSVIEREGGILEAIVTGKISISLLPEGTPGIVVQAWHDLSQLSGKFNVVYEWLYFDDGGADVIAVPVRPDEPALSSTG